MSAPEQGLDQAVELRAQEIPSHVSNTIARTIIFSGAKTLRDLGITPQLVMLHLASVAFSSGSMIDPQDFDKLIRSMNGEEVEGEIKTVPVSVNASVKVSALREMARMFESENAKPDAPREPLQGGRRALSRS